MCPSPWAALGPGGSKASTDLPPTKTRCFPRNFHFTPAWGFATPALSPLCPHSPTQCQHPWPQPPIPGVSPGPTAPRPHSDIPTALGSGMTGHDVTGPAEALTPVRPFSLSPVPRLLLLVCFVSDN